MIKDPVIVRSSMIVGIKNYQILKKKDIKDLG
jgi:hypothetical protein